jgi:hypothetical protein
LYAPRLSPGLKLRRYQRRSAFSRFTIAVGGDADVPTIRCNVGSWHFASFAALQHFGGTRRIADIVRDWREMARSRLTRDGIR